MPLDFVDLRIDHPEVTGALFHLPEGANASALEFEVARDRFIQLVEGEAGAACFEVRTAQGRTLRSRDANGRARRRARMRAGRSSVVQVTEDARDVVVYDENGDVQRVVALPESQGETLRVRAGEGAEAPGLDLLP